MIATISLESMKFYAFHGVTEAERLIGGTFLVDLSYSTETKSTETDIITDTINYADVYNTVKKEMERPSQLIEHVAGRIMNVVSLRFPQITKLTVRVTKCNPPVDGEVERASVTVRK